MSGRPPRSSTGKTKVVELLERNKNVQLPQPPSRATSPYVTAHCEGLWARTLMTVRCLPPVDAPGVDLGYNCRGAGGGMLYMYRLVRYMYISFDVYDCGK